MQDKPTDAEASYVVTNVILNSSGDPSTYRVSIFPVPIALIHGTLGQIHGVGFCLVLDSSPKRI